MPTLSRITVYPIKSLSGVGVESVRITLAGSLENDRRWAMVDAKGHVVSGKRNQQVFKLNAAFNLQDESVCFTNEQGKSEDFSLQNPRLLESFLSEQLDKKLYLKENKQQGFPDDIDANGPTLISQASLEEVVSWYKDLSIDDIRARFRINLEVDDAPAFWEDQLYKVNNKNLTLCVGDVEINPSNPCARCSVPIKEPGSGKPYNNFFETFIQKREQSAPSWHDPACFDHWYRLSANTRVNTQQAKKTLSLGDSVRVG
ncbi:MAG: hypothetical protein A6F71_06990 [Cycloclasticus sp. symbiont of Poecilosclerida sp. M]|nr:MAG: hypothetical protein A6F71_06990 [Cycloclasticus sp. symbiont of Poecilosclerida sp. M]